MNQSVSHGAAVIVITEDKILLAQMNYGPFKGQWILPGGTLEASEHPHETAIREVKEETGLDVEIKKLISIRHRIKEDHSINTYWIFSGEIKEDQKNKTLTWDRNELIEVKYWDINEAINDESVRPQTRYYIKCALGLIHPDSMEPLEAPNSDYCYHIG